MASYEQAKSILFNSVSRRTLYSLKIQNRGKNGITNPDLDLTKEESRYLKLFCSRITVPGISVRSMTSIGQEDMGIFRATPTEVRHGTNQLMVEMIENANFGAHDMVRKLFNQVAQGSNPRGKDRTIKMNYYNNYIRDIIVDKLEFPDGPSPLNNAVNQNELDFGYKRVARYKFERCYVSNIGEYVLDSSAFNDYLSFPVVFSYESFHVNSEKKYNVENPFDFMEMISIEGKTNFFERRVGEYALANKENNSNTTVFTFDDDF